MYGKLVKHLSDEIEISVVDIEGNIAIVATKPDESKILGFISHEGPGSEFTFSAQAGVKVKKSHEEIAV